MSLWAVLHNNEPKPRLFVESDRWFDARRAAASHYCETNLDNLAFEKASAYPSDATVLRVFYTGHAYGRVNTLQMNVETIYEPAQVKPSEVQTDVHFGVCKGDGGLATGGNASGHPSRGCNGCTETHQAESKLPSVVGVPDRTGAPDEKKSKHRKPVKTKWVAFQPSSGAAYHYAKKKHAIDFIESHSEETQKTFKLLEYRLVIEHIW